MGRENETILYTMSDGGGDGGGATEKGFSRKNASHTHDEDGGE